MEAKETDIQLTRTLKMVLQRHFGDNIQDVILFGSRAKGTPTEYSDYDVLILLKNDYDKEFRKKMSGIVHKMEIRNDVIFDEHLLSRNEIKNTIKGAEPVYVSAIKKGIYV